MKVGSKLYSILKNKCPQCHKGEFWPWRNPYYVVLVKGGAIYDRCSCCGLQYEKETGFWYGAMYVSYAIGVAVFVTAWIGTELFLSDTFPLLWQVVIIGASIVLLAPVNYYFSRLIWINFFVKFKGKNECKDSVQVKIVNR